MSEMFFNSFMFISHRFYTACILMLLLLSGCAHEKSVSKEQIEKIMQYDFTKFGGAAIFLRSYDWGGNPIYLVYPNGILKQDSCKSKVRVILRNEKRDLKEFNYLTICADDSLAIDSARIVLLTRSVDSLGITHLSFDSTKSISISTNSESINIMCFANDTLITDEVKRDWRALGNRWYMKVE